MIDSNINILVNRRNDREADAVSALELVSSQGGWVPPQRPSEEPGFCYIYRSQEDEVDLKIPNHALLAWFEHVNKKDCRKHLRTFWCIGFVDRNGIDRGDESLTERRSEAELKRYVIIPEITPSARYHGTIVAKMEVLFRDAPFLPTLPAEKTESDSETKFKREGVGRYQGKMFWTARAKQAWMCLNHYYVELVPEERPKLLPKPPGRQSR